MVFIARPLAERFWEKVAVAGPDDCWLWMGAKNGENRPCIKADGGITQFYAARVSWELANGSQGMAYKEVLHKCDNPVCMNPEHMFLGTSADNSNDKVAKRRHVFGETHPKAKLTEEQVLNIRRLSKLGMTHVALANRFGMSHQMISNIVKRRSWRHI